MLVEDIIYEVYTTANAPDETEESIIALINRGLFHIASRVLLDSLETEGTVEVGVTGIASIPDSWNFHRNLFQVNSDTRELQVLNSLEQLYRVYPDFNVLSSGTPKVALKQQNEILCFPKPEHLTEFKCKFFRKPEIVLNESESIVCIPEGLQEDLLVGFCCMRIFSRIEDSMEGFKVNTKHHKASFELAIERLEDAMQTGQSRALPRRSSSWV